MQELQYKLAHIHIFKNAGSSFDAVLKEQFADSMMNYDKPDAGSIIMPTELAELVTQHHNISVFSSHQFRLPLPVFDKCIIFPMFFLRDPIARVQSCFHFEKDVQKILPDECSMEEYVCKKLHTTRINAIIGLQSSAIGDIRMCQTAPQKSDLTHRFIETSKRNIASIAAFGLVEHYEKSLTLFEGAYSHYIPRLKFTAAQKTAKVNSGNGALNGVKEQVRYVQESLTNATYIRLLNQLSQEISLYRFAEVEFEKKMGKLAVLGWI